MAQTITGRDALRQLDKVIARTRMHLADAVEAADDSAARQAEVRKEQVSLYQALADMRLSLLSDHANSARLLETEKRALELLDSHDTFVAAQQQQLHAAAAEIKTLEDARADMAVQLDHAVDAYETRVSEVEASLAKDPAYQALAEALEDMAAISERAHSKLELAKEDRNTKGAPYDGDPLFSYLWKRGFRRPAYKASPFFRLLDNWVAKLCGYDNARLNYARLTELPIRLEEHARDTVLARDAAEDALEAAEVEALHKAGAEDLKNKADNQRSDLEALDLKIDGAEQRHQSLARAHEDAANARSGPAVEARRILEDALKKASFPDLRVLVAETVDVEDDRIVDRLVRLRTEELEFEITLHEVEARPASRRQDLALLEEMRRDFKTSRYDSPYATFKASTLDSAVSTLLRGETDVDNVLRMLGRAMSTRNPRVDPGFGGNRRTDTLGLPNVWGDVIYEIAKEAGRQGRNASSRRSPSPWGGRPTTRRFPSRRSSGGVSFPSSGGGLPRGGRRGGGGKGGGFKTGGGF